PYSSSYQVPPSMYDNSPVGFRIFQAPSAHNLYWYYPQGTRLGGRKLADVSNPSNKVLLMDEFDRHFTRRQPYYFLPQARQPLLSFDGGVNIRFTRDCNKGCDPNNPLTMTAVSWITYNPPGPWDPPAFNPAGDTWPGMYRYTRGGLRGIDFGGGEVR